MTTEVWPGRQRRACITDLQGLHASALALSLVSLAPSWGSETALMSFQSGGPDLKPHSTIAGFRASELFASPYQDRPRVPPSSRLEAAGSQSPSETVPYLPQPTIWDALQPSDALFPTASSDEPLRFTAETPNSAAPAPAPDSTGAAPYAPVVYEGKKRVADSSLRRTAQRVAPAVLMLTAWDEYGSPLAKTTGFFVSSSGLVLTDPSIAHPQLGTRIAYITATSGTRRHYRISGVWERDLTAGFALLQTAEKSVPHLAVSTTETAPQKMPVTVLGIDAKRGLVLADAAVSEDSARSGNGWLRVEGQDAPGAVGSPLFDQGGGVVGLISIAVSLDDWVSYAVPLSRIKEALGNRAAASLVAVEDLDGRGFKDVVEDRDFVAAVNELYEGSARRATRQLLELRRRYPRSAEVWAVLGIAWQRLDQPTEARACHERAVGLDPTVGAYWNQLALTQASAGQSHQSLETNIAALEKAIEESPGQRVATQLLAERYIEAGRFQDASDTLADLIKLRPGNAHAYYLLAHSRAKLGDWAAAEAGVGECLRRDPRHANAWFYLGMLKQRRGSADEALRAYENAARHDPRHPKAWLNLASAYRAAGNGPAAKRAMANHLELVDRREGSL